MEYRIGDRVYWRSMYGNLTAGTVLDKDHLSDGIRMVGMEVPAMFYPYLVLPDDCEYAIGMSGPFLTLPEVKVHGA